MSEENLLKTAEAVAGMLPRLARGLASAEKDPADDLPLAQLRLCGILSEGPRPMSALSRALGVSLSALTQIADRLERVRLVKRVAEENDRRVRCLQLTPRGEKMMRKRREDRVFRTVAVLERLSPPQREAVRASLEVLVDACSSLETDALDGRPHGNGRKAGDVAADGQANHHPSLAAAGKRPRSKVTL